MTWSDLARKRSLESRRSRRDRLDKLFWKTAMLVAAAGGGLSRLRRCMAADGVQEVEGRRRRGGSGKITNMQVYRVVCRMGLREAICPGVFRPGDIDPLRDSRVCQACRADLSRSPWCPCVPEPTWTCSSCGETRRYSDRSPCRCVRARKPSEPQRRLAKWAKEVREAKARKAEREARRSASLPDRDP